LPGEEQVTTRVIVGQAVSGVVVDPAGQPVGKATVTITGPETQAQTVTGEDGSWPGIPLLSGEYNFQVAAPGYGAWPVPRRLQLENSTSLTLTLAPLQNTVTAGDFEGNGVWQVWEWPQGQISLSIDAFDGQAGVRLGDGQGEAVACAAGSQEGQVWTLQQKVDLPAGQPLLSFMTKITTTQAASEQGWLEVALLAEGERHPLFPPETLWQATDWSLTTADLSQWAGKTVDLQFQVTRCSEQPLSVTLDRVSIGEAKGNAE
jgi:hypothetical protein